jgi:hypothetical protein
MRSTKQGKVNAGMERMTGKIDEGMEREGCGVTKG